MWFNNALVFNYELTEEFNLAEQLSEERLKSCPPHARFTYGWLPAVTDELAQEVLGFNLICLGKEERILPRAVIQHLLNEKIQSLESQGKTIKRSERAQLAEDLEFELLPKSFCIQKRLLAFFDSLRKRLIINTASPNQAAQLLALLRKSIPGIKIEPIFHEENLALTFAEWINNPSSLPSSFQLASDCLLFALDDEKKRINCKGYELPADEILTLLAQGLGAAEISLVWNERIKFTLTHDLILKRIKSMDYLIDEFEEIKQLDEKYEQQDAALSLLGGELRQLIDELSKTLGKKESLLDEPSIANQTVQSGDVPCVQHEV